MTGGPHEYDLHVHDNVIHGTVCDGLDFATVDPSRGTVEAYGTREPAFGWTDDPDASFVVSSMPTTSGATRS